MIENQVPFYLLIFLVGIGLGVLTFWAYHRFALGGFKRISKDIISRAEQETSELRKTNELSLKQKQVEYQRELEQMWQQERKKLQQEEERLKQREDKLESRMNLVEKKLSDTEKREAILIGRKAQLDEEKKQTIESHSKTTFYFRKSFWLNFF
ncbi:Rnase Y domain-containing protein [Candidatus Protochlamydia amoebophila]|uniref:Rnase Y domain-containing protein n=1 Tax=Candidatus Protochlamydia amoebophila TaxID=362787 RepID=UPI000ACF6011|nr:Rnase Y domain-containing protein [Candidatus Protochlamydia amoebophila]